MKRKNLLFAVMTALFLLAAPSLRAESSGTCGDNVTWALDDQGVLTISGTGAMKDYSYDSSSPLSGMSFTSLVIKDGVTTIGNYAFFLCKELTSVDIPNSVTSIGENAFTECKALTSVDIPNSVTSIGDEAFAYTGLTSITVAPENSTYDSRDNCNAIIETKTNTLIAGCKNATIPSSVTSIGDYAFTASGLTSVTIPGSVTSIGECAFAECDGLEKIECLAEVPPTCGEDVFYNVDMNTCELYVPESAIDAYRNAEVWKDFTNINIVTGISGVAQESNVGVSASNGTISVTGAAAGTVVEVYSTNGTQVYRGTGNTVNVPSAGMYVVRAAGKTFKVNAAR